MDITRLRSENTFQQVLIQLAMRFINCPVSDMDATLIAALRQVVEALGAMRASINIVNEDRAHYTNLYEWQSPQYPVLENNPQPFPDKTDLMPMMEQGGAVLVHDRHQLPDDSELKRLLAQEGITASAGVPVIRDGKLFAVITMSWDAPYDISPEIVNLLRVVGEIFLNVLLRKENEDQLEQRVQERTGELRQSEHQLRTILESLSIPIIVTDATGTLLYINPTATHVLGGDLKKIYHQLNSDFYVDLEQREALRQQIVEQGYVKDYELTYHILDDVERTGLVSVRPFVYMGESAFLTSFIDVTELKRIQRVEQEQRVLSEALLDSAMVLMGTLELNEVIDHILSNLRRVVVYDTCNVMIIENEDGVILGYRSFVENGIREEPPRRRIPLKGAHYPNLMIETKQPIRVGNTTGDMRLIRITHKKPILAYLGVPIIIRQEVVGFINLGHCQAHFFTDAHIKYLQLFALQAGLALQNAHHFHQARAIAALEERQRLARDLHDSVSQTLFSANSIAEMLPLILERKPEKMPEYLDELMMLTRGAMSEMRTLLVELRPEALTQTEFSILIGHLCDVFTGKTQIDVTRRINKKMVLPPDVQIGFYRVAQEALNNIAKHAQATHVELTVNIEADCIEMRIRDDGIGFDAQQVSAERFGLKIMRERAKEIGATLNITSQHGTEIVLRKP